MRSRRGTPQASCRSGISQQGLYRATSCSPCRAAPLPKKRCSGQAHRRPKSGRLGRTSPAGPMTPKGCNTMGEATMTAASARPHWNQRRQRRQRCLCPHSTIEAYLGYLGTIAAGQTGARGSRHTAPLDYHPVPADLVQETWARWSVHPCHRLARRESRERGVHRPVAAAAGHQWASCRRDHPPRPPHTHLQACHVTQCQRR